MENQSYRLGIDIGSTTVKTVVLDNDDNILFSEYRRHNANVVDTLSETLAKVTEKLGDINASTVITGSVGMGYAEKIGTRFVQEVIASTEWIKEKYPQVRTFVDIGGEDSKMIFLQPGKTPDIRMNGSCAGGTGAFIDQTATLLGIEPIELNQLAADHKTIYPIASRCGVFSKTDIQNLISRNTSKQDIAASVLNSVAMQVTSSLARGTDIVPPILFCGGPFKFIPQLKESFINILKINNEDCIIPENTELFPALGCAFLAKKYNEAPSSISDLIKHLNKEHKSSSKSNGNVLRKLFNSEEEFQSWKTERQKFSLKSIVPTEGAEIRCHLGVDSGSTTTKVVLIDDNLNIIYKDYRRNNGNSFRTFVESMEALQQFEKEKNINIRIVSSTATGYGENLLKKAFNLNNGIVETIAHYIAAREVCPEVSFVLDIGGQDMKAIFIDNGSIKRIEINEACSSGCGSFIETYANMLNYPVAEFARMACTADQPYDLGTRCTVFMNSKVKQSLREGTSIEDIAAGFSYSVIKNCLFKVLKLKNLNELGDNIVVQGGTMKNLSIVKALEVLTGKNVFFSDIPELMGAFGAAIYGKSTDCHDETSISELIKFNEYKSSIVNCKGCENQCTVNIFKFENGNSFYAGNNCEKVFSNRSESTAKGINLHAEKDDMLFEKHENSTTKNGKKVGLPRALGMYENFQFWQAMFSTLGYEVVLSGDSTNKLYEPGVKSIMSDNICFPAKLMNGHILDLVNKKVDFIFYPYIVLEVKDDEKSNNSYNCPIVSGYGDVIKSSIDTENKYGIRFDNPIITFSNDELLWKSCNAYLKSLGFDKKMRRKAIENAIEAQANFRARLTERTAEVIEKANRDGRTVIVLAGRPYHIDPLIQHKVSQAVAEMGIDVVTENVSYLDNENIFDELHSLTQWSFPTRIFKAAHYVANAPDNVQFIELTSFGCGPDAFILDEMGSILNRKGKNLTILKIDDVNNIGSLRLRIRSLVESLKLNNWHRKETKFVTTKPFMEEDRRRLIIGPYFAEGYSEFIPAFFKAKGYNLLNLPKGTPESNEYGLKYANNDICYPATIVIGTIMMALESGKFNPDDIAVAITQTGGQCRASNYLSLIKNAMVTAGFENIPVVSVATGSSKINYQPGFDLHVSKNIGLLLNTMLYADCLSKLYQGAVIREKEKGIARKIRDKYTEMSFPYIENKQGDKLQGLLKKAVAEFRENINEGSTYPTIGIVGEIYLKYNAFSNKYVVDWLNDQGFEVAVPSIYNFFINGLVNNAVNRKYHIKPSKTPAFVTTAVYNLIARIARKYDKICAGFPSYRPFDNLFEAFDDATKIVNPATNFGEGWLLPAEIANYAKNGINSVVSLQPFGCIANHIISKGMEKKIKQIYPDMNLLFLDFDAGTSEANVFNRLHFILENAKSKIKQG